LGIVRGVWRTRVGYAGGDYASPTYRRLGDQTECFQVDFDPAVVSYGELVSLALASHNPRWKAHKLQYASLVLAHDDEQLAVAQERSARVAAALGGPLVTRIEPLKKFWLAEDYHQKYYLRNDRTLAADFRAMFDGDETAFRESTSAARVNGYVAGNGTRVQLAREIDFLGLSEGGRARLITRVGDSASGAGCSVL
jgi:peptide-methionine (S)-S-oxide reductase